MAPLRRLPRPLAFWVLAATALLAGHDLVYLVQVGPGEQLTRLLREAGHGYWGAASLLLVVVGAVVLAVTGLRLLRLRHEADALGAAPVRMRRSFGARWAVAWWRLLAAVAIGFVVQENLEHWIAHGHMPGLGALVGPEYPLAIPVIGLITGLAAVAAAFVGEAEATLAERIAAALARRFARPPRRAVRPTYRIARPRIAPLAAAAAGRAPPSVLLHVT